MTKSRLLLKKNQVAGIAYLISATLILIFGIQHAPSILSSTTNMYGVALCAMLIGAVTMYFFMSPYHS